MVCRQDVNILNDQPMAETTQDVIQTTQRYILLIQCQKKYTLVG